MYTNKVIENFNAGILELDTNDEMGVTTLRSYLSKKLGCDPMRITKKYTGSSCLGKKVYHADNFRGFNRVEIDNAAKELRILEQKFRSKLDEINRKKTSGLYVSTPSIDALIRNTSPEHMVGEKRKIENRGSSSEGVTEESGEHNLQQRITNNEYSSSINFPDDIISNLLSHVRPQNIGDLIDAYRNQPDLLNKEASIPPQETFRSEEYRDAILPILNSVSSVFSITLATGAHSFLSDHSAATNFHVDTYYSSSTNNNNSFTNDSTNIASSSSAMGSNLAIASSSSSSCNNISSSRRSDYDNSRMYGSMQMGKHLDEGGYSSMRDIGGAESNHGNGYGNVADSNLLALESDQNAAADSLIGFINHIHREQSRSHDDLVDYVESVMVESVERRSRSYNDLTSLSPHNKHGKSLSLHDNSNHHLGYSQESKSTHGDKDYCTKLTCVTGSSPRKSRSHNDLFDLIEKLVGCSEESNDVVAIDREDRKNKLSIRTVLSDS